MNEIEVLNRMIEKEEANLSEYRHAVLRSEVFLATLKDKKAAYTEQEQKEQEHSEQKKNEASDTPEEKTVSFTEVRGIMATLSGQGKKMKQKPCSQSMVPAVSLM